MKRSRASWTTAIAASALLAMPVGSWAQQTSPSAPAGSTRTSPTSRPAGEMQQQGSANEHLRQAMTALNDIPAASLTGTAKTRVAELKRHITTLEQSAGGQAAAAGANTSRTTRSTAAKGNWSSDVAAADRILTELLGAQSTTGATEPASTGTAGTTGATTRSTTTSKTATAITLDDTARTKLQEVRTHLTAFAAGMSGSAGSTEPAPSTSAASAQPAAGASATAATPAEAGAAASTTAAASSSAGAPAAQGATPQAGAAQPAAAAAPQQAQVDADSVKRHLTAARDSLSQLTQLPAAAQLTGDARTQVSQLISNFNELITTNSNWRASYDKVQANLTALVGEQRTDESPAPATGTAGAVGTSGTVAIDPTLRAKLVELRSHLMEFEKAAGGGASPSANSANNAAADANKTPDAAASAKAEPAAATSSAAPAAAETAAAAGTAGSTAAQPAPAGTSGSATAAPAATGTTGSTATPAPEAKSAPDAAAAQSAAAPRASRPATAEAAGQHQDAMRHIEAIEAILNGASGATGTAGTAAKTKAAAGTLDRAQIEQIRTHLAELRKGLAQSNK